MVHTRSVSQGAFASGETSAYRAGNRPRDRPRAPDFVHPCGPGYYSVVARTSFRLQLPRNTDPATIYNCTSAYRLPITPSTTTDVFKKLKQFPCAGGQVLEDSLHIFNAQHTRLVIICTSIIVVIWAFSAEMGQKSYILVCNTVFFDSVADYSWFYGLYDIEQHPKMRNRIVGVDEFKLG